MTSKKNGQTALKQLCQERGVEFKDVDRILTLYGLDLPEEDIETETQKYPKEAIALASNIILGRF